MADESPKRDEVLLRLLKTPPQPKASKPKTEPLPDKADHEALIERGKRNIQDNETDDRNTKR